MLSYLSGPAQPPKILVSAPYPSELVPFWRKLAANDPLRASLAGSSVGPQGSFKLGFIFSWRRGKINIFLAYLEQPFISREFSLPAIRFVRYAPSESRHRGSKPRTTRVGLPSLGPPKLPSPDPKGLVQMDIPRLPVGLSNILVVEGSLPPE